MTRYLQFGRAPGPFRTVRVPAKRKVTASMAANALHEMRDTRTDTLVLFEGRWRRVQCRHDGWRARDMIRIDGEWVEVQDA